MRTGKTGYGEKDGGLLADRRTGRGATEGKWKERKDTFAENDKGFFFFIFIRAMESTRGEGREREGAQGARGPGPELPGLDD